MHGPIIFAQCVQIWQSKWEGEKRTERKFESGMPTQRSPWWWA